jgi:hypothetical protein
MNRGWPTDVRWTGAGLAEQPRCGRYGRCGLRDALSGCDRWRRAPLGGQGAGSRRRR